MQSLRNCNGKGDPAKISLNNNFYKRCPKAIFLEGIEARYLSDLYIECRENKILPYPGGPNEQTQFTKELFNYLDSLVNSHRNAQHKKAMADLKKKKPTSV